MDRPEPDVVTPPAQNVRRRRGVHKAQEPLTHHEILRIVEPFARRGRHVDLTATDRVARRLVFREIIHEGETALLSGMREGLTLENPRPGAYRLLRTLTSQHGAIATLVTDGAQPGELLARIESVAPPSQFQVIAGVVIGQSYRLEPGNATTSDATQPARLVLTAAQARLRHLTLTLRAETGRGYPAEIDLLPETAGLLELPDDVLATLGWDWKILRRRGGGWTTTLRVPRREPERSRRIEVRLGQAIAHLDRTLAEPPRLFHDRLVRARWIVVFRRAIPLLACLALIVGTLALTRAEIPQDSIIVMMIFNLPPLLMLVLFGMRELPRFEIPPLPRASDSASWLRPAAPADATKPPSIRAT